MDGRSPIRTRDGVVPAGADAGGSVVVLVLYCTLGARWNRIAPCCRLGHTSDFLRAQASGEESGGLLGRYRTLDSRFETDILYRWEPWGGNLSPVATDRHSAQRHSICVSRRPPKGLVHEHVSRRPRSLRSTSEQCDPGVAGVCGRSRQRHAKGEVQMRYSEIRHAPRHAQPRA